jgi:putative transposase
MEPVRSAIRRGNQEEARRAHTWLHPVVLQKFSSIPSAVHDHFNHERHLVSREIYIYKGRRSAAMTEWRTIMA